MKIGSLFDGSGGFPLAATICGMQPVWASEIEPYPLKVTAARFPNMVQLGDVTKINGAAIEPVDVITFGSPCQDLSVAGKQKGIHEGERSNLFFEAVRIIKEMREKDEAIGRTDEHVRPRFAVWENVPGAFSSNKGADFQAVLQALCKVRDPDADVPFPAKGKWQKAGCIVGDGYSIAWRVYDAQFWGVPQRRKRIYLIADFGSERAGEILFECEGMRGDSEASYEAWKDFTAHAVGGADRSGADGVSYAPSGNHCGVYAEAETRATLTTKRHYGSGGDAAIVVYDCRGNGNGKTVPTLTGDHQNRVTDYTSVICGQHQATVGVFMGGQEEKAGSIAYSEETSPTLRASESGTNRVPDVVYAVEGNTVDRASSKNGKGWCEGVSPTLNTQDRHAVAVDCRNLRINEELSGTLQAKNQGGHSLNYQNPIVYDKQRFGVYGENGVGSTLAARDYKDASDLVVQKAEKPPRKYIVRRLTPLECCRLQGFPDWWEDGVEGSDSARYKMWGNGIALPCAVDVLNRIEKAIQNT